MTRLILGIVLLIFTALPLYAADEAVYYAKCNLRAHWHNVSAENWLAYEVGIPAGARITAKEKVYEYESSNGETTTTAFKLVTDDGEAFKFPDGPRDRYLQREPLDLAAMPPNVQLAIKTGEPVSGMTKDQVLITLCAPAYVMQGVIRQWVTDTEKLTLDEIKGYNLWVYRRKRIGKSFHIQFNDQGAVEKMYWALL